MAHIQIANIDPIVTYTVGGSARSTFPVPFPFFDDGDLVVTINSQIKTLTADYTVSGAGDSEGGEITLITPVTSSTVIIERDVPIERTTDFPNSGPLNTDALNTQLDKLVAIDQQLEQRVDDAEASVTAALEVFDAITGVETTANYFATRAAAAASTIASSVTYVRTEGLATVGDGGGKLYVEAVGATPGGFQSVDGQWWQIAGSAQPPSPPGVRVSTSSGVAVTEADATGVTTLYLVITGSNAVEVYDGSSFVSYAISELTLNLDSNAAHTGYHQSGKGFYVGAFHDGTNVVYGSSVGWTADTNPGSGAATAEAEVYQGRLVNKYAMTVRFGSSAGNTFSVPARQFSILGGFYTSANGMTEDSAKKRFVSNLYNVVDRAHVAPAADAVAWLLSAATYQQANANAANQFEYFHVAAGRVLNASVVASSIGTSATKGFYVPGIGIDSVTVNSANGGYAAGNSDNTIFAPALAIYRGTPGIGKHTVAWLEYQISANRTVAATSQYGISGTSQN